MSGFTVRKRTWKTPAGKRGSAWVIDYRDPATGERRRDTMDLPSRTSAADAWAAGQKIYEDKCAAAVGLAAPNLSSVLTLSGLLTAHRARPGISEWTRQIEEKQAKNIIRVMPAGIAVASVTTAILEDYAVARAAEPNRKRPAKPPTIVKELALIRQAVRWGHDTDKCGPFAAKLPALRPAKYRAKFLSVEETNKLFAACGDDSTFLRQAAEICFLLGVRRLELFTLRWEDVDFGRACILVHTKKSGRGAVKFTDQMFLSARAIDLLKLRQQASGSSPLIFGDADGGLLRGKLPTYEPFDFRAALRRAAKAAGIRDVTVHTLRHSCSSQLRALGFSSNEAGAHLRHRDGGRLIDETYGHVYEEKLRMAADALANNGRSPGNRGTNLAQTPARRARKPRSCNRLRRK